MVEDRENVRKLESIIVSLDKRNNQTS